MHLEHRLRLPSFDSVTVSEESFDVKIFDVK